MSDYLNMHIGEDYISLSFDVAHPAIIEIGEKMNGICEEAYMNGYNWDAFFNCYLAKNAPDILEIIDSDPEAELYSVFIEEVNDQTRSLARKFADLIEDLFANEAKIYAFLEENAEEIEWD